MSALVESNKDYSSIRMINVDWDDFKKAPIISELGVKRHSTLVMFKGGEEVGRLLAQTSTASIEELLKKAI